MSTTHLFVELLVIGFGGLIWLFLWIAPLLGFRADTSDPNLALSLVLPVLSFAYILGILVDRVADRLFKGKDRSLRQGVYPEKNGKELYYNDRRSLVVHCQPLWEHMEYGRSRLRICRGWALNLALIIVVLLTDLMRSGGSWLSAQSTSQCLGVFGLLLILCAACVVSWWMLSQSEYKKIRRQARWLRERKSEETSSDIQ